MNTENLAPDLEEIDPNLARIAELEAELLTVKDTAMRMLAEADNIKKRAEKMVDDTRKYAVTGFAKDMLDSADNLRRALGAVKPEFLSDNELFKTLVDGVSATERVMLNAFERQGIRKIEPQTGVFDPNLHEVIFEADVPGKTKGEIIQLVDTGYVLHDRLLRAAKVGVAKGDPLGTVAGIRLDEQA
jgi:molecular chaperone GrpE